MQATMSLTNQLEKHWASNPGAFLIYSVETIPAIDESSIAGTNNIERMWKNGSY